MLAPRVSALGAARPRLRAVESPCAPVPSRVPRCSSSFRSHFHPAPPRPLTFLLHRTLLFINFTFKNNCERCQKPAHLTCFNIEIYSLVSFLFTLFFCLKKKKRGRKTKFCLTSTLGGELSNTLWSSFLRLILIYLFSFG